MASSLSSDSLGTFLATEESTLDVRENSAVSNRGLCQHLGELVVVANSQLEVARSNRLLLEFSGSVSSQLEDLVGEVLEDGSGEDASTHADLISVATLLEVAVGATDRENEVAARRVGLGLSSRGGCFSFACHLLQIVFSYERFNYKVGEEAFARLLCLRTFISKNRIS